MVRGLAVDAALSGLPGVQFGVNWSWFLKKKANSVGGPEGLAMRDRRYANASGGGHGWPLPGRLPLSLEPFTLRHLEPVSELRSHKILAPCLHREAEPCAVPVLIQYKW